MYSEVLVKYRAQDLMREASQRRLARSMQAEHRRLRLPAARVHALGQALVTMGTRLQAPVPATKPAIRTTNVECCAA